MFSLESFDTAKGILDSVIARGGETISEHESKRLLAAYGVPIVKEVFVKDAAAAGDAAESLGYPVALKGCAAGVAHKSDLGLVVLHLNDRAAVAAAAAAMQAGYSAGPLEGFLVQRMARGKREVIAGGLRDAVFGPCVMLGTGGIAVEALGDVAFRLAPLEERDALEMMGELRARKIFDAFRGEPAADRAALAQVLRAVGQILLDHPRIAQIDVNPFVLEDGRPVAVDAHIVLRADENSAASSAPQPAPEQFQALFAPESVAIVGATDSPGKWGFRILFNALEGGYQGRLYGVNPKHTVLLGVPCFPSVSALPEAVDLALIVVPPQGVHACLRECAAKGVRAAVVITAGFGELNDSAARAAQAELIRMARDSGMLVVGPNCAGVASPAPKQLFCGMIARYPGAGKLSIVSQSGNVGGTALTWAALHQVGLARFVSSGNEAAAQTEDYLAFFAEDPQTASILSYVEGARDGRRFFEALRAAAARKPVVLIKGGRSQAGMKAAQSHTGALASEVRLFQAACRQAGAVVINDTYEAMEAAGVFACQPLPKGRRVGIISQGGGWGVITADACAEAGLDVAALPPETLAELDAFLPAWWNRGNPIDLVAGTDLTLLSRTVEVIMRCPAVDAVILLGIGYIASSRARLAHSPRAKEHGLDKLSEMGALIEVEDIQRIAESAVKHGKPLITASDTVLMAYGAPPNDVVLTLERLGFYLFSSPAHAARTLARMAERHEFLQGLPRSAQAKRG